MSNRVNECYIAKWLAPIHLSDSDEHPEPELGPEIEILPCRRKKLEWSQFT